MQSRNQNPFEREIKNLCSPNSATRLTAIRSLIALEDPFTGEVPFDILHKAPISWSLLLEETKYQGREEALHWTVDKLQSLAESYEDCANIFDITIVEQLLSIAKLVLTTRDELDYRIRALDAIATLARKSRAAPLIMQANGIPTLLQILSSNFPRGALANSLRALINLARNDEQSLELIGKNGGIPIFVNMLNDKENRGCAAETLWHLARNNSNQKRIAESGAIPLLIRLLSSTDKYDSMHALYAINRLAGNSTAAPLIVQANGIPILLGILKQPNLQIKLRDSAIETLAKLADKVEKSRELIANQGGIPLFIAILNNTENGNGHEYAAETLWYLARNTDNQSIIAKLEGILPLIKLLSSQNSKTKRYASAALMNLADDHEDNQLEIVALNAIPKLVNLLQDNDADTKENAAGALANLSANSENQKDISGSIELIRQYLPTSTGYTKRYIQTILANCEPAKTSQATTSAKPQTTVTPKMDSSTIPPVNLSPPPRPAKVATPEQPKPQVKEVTASKVASSTTTVNLSPPAPPKIATSVQPKSAGKEITSLLQPLNHLSLGSIPKIRSQEFLCEVELGRGGFGVVYKGLWNKAPVAIKKLQGPQLDNELLAEFNREAQVHAGLRHPNIITLYGICDEIGNYAMILEFMIGGSLHDFLIKPGHLAWGIRLRITEGIVSGMIYLHERNIIHRDLKSLNILIDDKQTAKIADFGLAKIKNHTLSSMTAAGTPYWMAPELFDNGSCTKASDIYALGIVFWEIANRTYPYTNKHGQYQIIKYVVEGGREEIPTGTPVNYGKLIQRCWAGRAADRPTIQEVSNAMPSINDAPTVSALTQPTVFQKLPAPSPDPLRDEIEESASCHIS